MLQSFSVTWTGIVIILLPFLALYFKYVLGILHTNKKSFAFFFHPAVLLIGFTVLAVKFLHL